MKHSYVYRWRCGNRHIMKKDKKKINERNRDRRIQKRCLKLYKTWSDSHKRLTLLLPFRSCVIRRPNNSRPCSLCHVTVLTSNQWGTRLVNGSSCSSSKVPCAPMRLSYLWNASGRYTISFIQLVPRTFAVIFLIDSRIMKVSIHS